MSRAHSWCSLALVVCVACGGAPKPVAAPPAVVSAPVVRAEQAPEEAPDLSPVSAPSDLFFLARFKSPRQTAETVAALAKYPFKLHDVLSGELHPLEAMIAWDAPVEVASVLDEAGEGKFPEPLTAVSFGVASVDAVLSFAKAQGWSAHKTAPGVYQLGDEEDMKCVVSRALGAAPARVVCGHRTHDLDGLLPYMTRGLPNEALSASEMSIELRAAPIKRKYAGEIASARMLAGFLLREVQKDSPRLDRALSDATYAVLDEAVAFIADFDSLTLDAKLDASAGDVVFGINERFSGARSWIVQNGMEVPQGAAPDAFWQLPADATVASWSGGLKPGRLKPIGRSLGELLAGYLEYEKAPVKVRDQWSKLVQTSFDDSLGYVSAKGELKDMPSDPALALGYRLFGWQLVGTPGEAKHYQGLLEDLGAALDNRDFQRLLKTKAQIEPQFLPKVHAHNVTIKGFKAGARQYELELPRALVDLLAMYQSLLKVAAPKAKGAAGKGLPVTVIIAHDDDRTWLSFSADAKVARARLEGLHDAGTPRLGSRTDLGALKDGSATSGGYMELKSLASTLRAVASDADAATVLNALPHHGETPITVGSSLHAGASSELGFHMRVPRAALEDIGALIPVFALLGRHRHGGAIGLAP